MGRRITLLVMALCASCSSQQGSTPSAYCPGESIPEGMIECRRDADCGEAARCEAPSVAQAQPIVAMVPPCQVLPPCTSDTECGEGAICEVWRPDLVPSPPLFTGSICPTSEKTCVMACGCMPDERCREDGRCEIAPCDAQGAPACPAGTACMPGVVDEGVELSRVAQAGCVRVRCDEPGGVVCEDGWTCDPERAPMMFETPPWAHTAGCAPIACDDGWTCESSLVCYPDGASTAVAQIGVPFATREDGRWVDVHGCVQPNCEEGWSCASIGPTECAVDHVDADNFGCRKLRCDEPGGADCAALASGQSCQPDLEPNPSNLAQWGCGFDLASSSGGSGGGGDGGAAGTHASGGGGDGGAAGVTSSGGGAGTGSTPTRGDAPSGAACMRDEDCACGSCVLDRCAPRPGVCIAE